MLAWMVLATTLTTTAPAVTGDHEAAATRLETELVSPCCWRQQVSIHDSPIAEAIRADVRARLARGETPEQIKARYVEQYGTAILVEPPASGFSVLLYVMPPLVFVASGALLVVLVRRFIRPAPPGPVSGNAPDPRPALTPSTPEDAAGYDRRLNDDLSQLD